MKDITERSADLTALSDDELEVAYDHILEQFALELLIGAHENSDWSNGKLVIDWDSCSCKDALNLPHET